MDDLFLFILYMMGLCGIFAIAGFLAEKFGKK